LQAGEAKQGRPKNRQRTRKPSTRMNHPNGPNGN
jgi:hypothetical protein